MLLVAMSLTKYFKDRTKMDKTATRLANRGFNVAINPRPEGWMLSAKRGKKGEIFEMLKE